MPEPKLVIWNCIFFGAGDQTHAGTDGADRFIFRDLYIADAGNDTIDGLHQGAGPHRHPGRLQRRRQAHPGDVRRPDDHRS